MSTVILLCRVHWKVNAAPAKTSKNRSLTTGELVGFRITDSTVSINVFAAV